jgi:hypothetical protein
VEEFSWRNSDKISPFPSFFKENFERMLRELAEFPGFPAEKGNNDGLF